MIIDTDVLVWYMRGHKKAYQLIEKQKGFFMSVVTYMELLQGMRNKKELKALRKAMKEWQAKLLYIDETISVKAMFYVEQHFLSHSVQLADALIAATAAVNHLPLVTANDKHYKIIKEVKLRKFLP